jgi:hypothetical protein
MVRTLLRAIEHPQGPYPAVRPKKIVVSDREEQFYLRGVLRDLDIDVDYAAELPLIAQLFERFGEISETQQPQLPQEYHEILETAAQEIWSAAPWRLLADHQIISIELQRWDVDSLYACVMGMMGMEYGILLYRSVESLHQFRQAALYHDGLQDMEAAFLSQDCIFLTFETDVEPRKSRFNPKRANFETHFGTIHPLEGMRAFLDPEEALATYAALTALQRFVTTHEVELDRDDLPEISQKIRLNLPTQIPNLPKSIDVTVATMPQVSQELWDMQTDEEFDDDDDDDITILEDLIPEKAFISLGMIRWEQLQMLHPQAVSLQGTPTGDGLPVIMVQSTRTKAQAMIDKITAVGGVRGITFNPGEDPFVRKTYELGIIQLADGQMQLFGEFALDSPIHLEARRKWTQRCQQTNNQCGLIIAQGLTGKAKGNPQPKDMLAVIETQFLDAEELGLGVLKLVTDFVDID